MIRSTCFQQIPPVRRGGCPIFLVGSKENATHHHSQKLLSLLFCFIFCNFFSICIYTPYCSALQEGKRLLYSLLPILFVAFQGVHQSQFVTPFTKQTLNTIPAHSNKSKTIALWTSTDRLVHSLVIIQRHYTCLVLSSSVFDHASKDRKHHPPYQKRLQS